MKQQEAYRKIEQRIAIMKVLLDAGVITAECLNADCVSNAINHIIKRKISPSTHTPNDIIVEFMELHAFYSMNNGGYNG